MFTGLISAVGIIQKLRRSPQSGMLEVGVAEWSPDANIGDSIAVDGACLTLVQRHRGLFVFDVLSETLRRTSLVDKAAGSPVNLESAVKWGQAMGGHWVTGHVDGVGIVSSIRSIGRDREVRIQCQKDLLDDMVVKGSVACDGISLTLVDVNDASFSVHVIPHTWEHTAWKYLRVESKVNIETDAMAKYVRRYLEKWLKSSTGSQNTRISDLLREVWFE